MPLVQAQPQAQNCFPIICSNARSAWSRLLLAIASELITKRKAPRKLLHGLAVRLIGCSTLDCSANSAEEDVIIERLHKDFDRAFSHRLYAHSRIAMCSYENDGNLTPVRP